MLEGLDEEQVQGGSPNAKEITAAFREFDSNKDGFIDAMELKEALRVLSGGAEPPSYEEVWALRMLLGVRQWGRCADGGDPDCFLSPSLMSMSTAPSKGPNHPKGR